MESCKNNDRDIITAITSFLVVAFPVLDYYQGPVFSYGEWLFIILIIIVLFTKYKKTPFVFPKHYFWFWGYSAIALLLVGNFKVTYLIPGGVNLFLWSLILGLSCRFLSIDKVYVFLKPIVLISVAVLFIQEFQFFAFGNRFCAFLPLSSELTYGVSFDELSAMHMSSERSSSIFAEPAHFAIYILVFLSLEMFQPKNRGKLFSMLSLLLVLALFVLRSGNGFIGLLVLGIIKVIDYYRFKGGKGLIFLLIIIPIAFWGISRYATTEVGGSVLERTEELNNDEDTRSYIRIFRGYVVYESLPLKTQVFGTTMEELESMNIPILNMYKDREHNLYFNGLQEVLIYQGIIGLLLLLMVYIKLFKEGDMASRSSIILMLVIAALGDFYLSPMMLLYTTVGYSCKKIERNGK